MNEETNKTTPSPAERVLEALRAIHAYRNSDSPTGTPTHQYQQISNLPLKTIIGVLNDAKLPDDEYEQLVRFAANELHTPELERSISHTQDEFVFLRQRLGASQQWIADQIGVSTSTIRRWEDPSSGYVPSEKAWRRLEQLEHDEYEWAMTAVNSQIKNLQKMFDACERDPFILSLHIDAPDDSVSLELGIHHYRTQGAYQHDVESAKPIDWEKCRANYDGDYPEEIDEAYADWHIDFQQGNLWSVFPQAGTYDIQNAITNRIYEIIHDKTYDRTLTKRKVTVSFAEGAGTLASIIQ